MLSYDNDRVKDSILCCCYVSYMPTHMFYMTGLLMNYFSLWYISHLYRNNKNKTVTLCLCSFYTCFRLKRHSNVSFQEFEIYYGQTSSVRIPNSINNFRTLIPVLRLRPLNLSSASSVNLHGLANTSIFHNNLRVMLSPLKSQVLLKYSNPFKRP